MKDIRHIKQIKAPIRKVWDALTDSKTLEKWIMPNNFKPTLDYEFTFLWGQAPDWDGVIHCKIVELAEPEKLAYTWRGAPGVPETLVTFSLMEEGGVTVLELVHSGWENVSEAHRSVYDTLNSGWGSQVLENLVSMVETGEPRFSTCSE